MPQFNPATAILNLLVDLQQREGVTFLFISHDLGVVRYLADRIAVMYRGRIVEIGPAEAVFGGPHHPYTAALLSAVPGTGHRRVALPDGPPGPDTGCVFSGRCPRKLGAVCETEAPPFEAQDGHAIRCHIPRDGLSVGRQEIMLSK